LQSPDRGSAKAGDSRFRTMVSGSALRGTYGRHVARQMADGFLRIGLELRAMSRVMGRFQR